jgi:hypothetical protein
VIAQKLRIFFQKFVIDRQLWGNLKQNTIRHSAPQMNHSDLLYHRQRYSGKVQPQNMVFNANLQEFSQKVSYITGLETAGKITPEDSYRQIKKLWNELKSSKRQLGIGENSSALGEME